MTDLEMLFAGNAKAFHARHSIIGQIDLGKIFTELEEEEKNALAAGVKDGRWLYRGKLLHSERDPAREAQRSADAFTGARALLCISAGAGFLFSKLPAQVTQVLLLEPDRFCLAAFILKGEFRNYRGTITLFADSLERSDALEEILPWLQGKNLRQTFVYCHAPMLQIDKPRFTRAYERVVQLFEKRSVNQATIIKFQQLWNKNIFLNQRAIRSGGMLKQIWNAPPPEAIVLAGAGPSLSDSAGDLLRFRSRYILFAADTAFIPLARAGIYPDFVFAADPQWLNHYFVQSYEVARSTWVMDPVVCPAIPRHLQRHAASMLFWNNVFLADTHFRKEDRGDVAHGGSVSTNAFDAALTWLSQRSAESAGRIILVGQDLSFSNRQAHTKGAVLEAQVFTSSNRLKNMELHNYRQMTAMPVLWQRGLRQNQVRTNGKLKIFHEWFEARAAGAKKSNIRFINATADGVWIQGFEHLSLSEAFAGLSGNISTAWQPVQNIPVSGVAGSFEFLQKLKNIESLMSENAKLAGIKDASPGTIQKLNANDAEFKSLGFAKDIVALNAQALILKITEQGGEADAVEFYRAMAHAARAIRHWAGKSL